LGARKEHRVNKVGKENISSFAPLPILTPHHFGIAENGRGYWTARDKEGLIGGVFRIQKEALRFALFEAGGNSSSVRVLPCKSEQRRAFVIQARG
jgi:hypothetical protein